MTYFTNIETIQFEGKNSKNLFSFKYYNPDELVAGKTMKEHLRFAIAYWHTFTAKGSDPFGADTMVRPWDDQDPMEAARKRAYAAFEFFEKIQAPYFCFHDADIAPEGATLEETNQNIDEIVAIFKKEMKRTGIKLLWNTSNAFTHPRFVHGAGTSCNAEVYARAAAQIKKGLEVANELGAENYVFWGGREGYESLYNTDMKRELDNLAYLYEMAINYAKEIGFTGQFLIEPKPKEPTKHQYDYDCATTIAFLKTYNLDKHFKLNIEANHATLAGHSFDHELRVARIQGLLGSIDANQGDLFLGWDTDEFPTDLHAVSLAMYEILENGGLHSGGVNFDAKLRRSSFELEDLFLGHIAGMDTFARGLKIAARLKEEKFFDNLIEARYASFGEGIGLEITNKQATLASLETYAHETPDIQNKSDRLEYVKALLNEYIY